MRRSFLQILLAVGLLIPASSSLFSQLDCGIKGRSCINSGTAPQPFQELKGPNLRWDHDKPAISTGYYFVTSESTIDDPDNYWKPKASDFMSEEKQKANWRTVVTGPRQVDSDFWDDTDKNFEGHAFFRDPASNNGDVFEHGEFVIIDSTDDAIAGPIPLKLAGGFRFNGIRYDSFYVSTNGLIGLSNRRYTYENGVRAIDDKTNDAYDRESMDWYSRGRTNEGNGGGTADVIPDDYGYRYVACGGTPATPRIGLRTRGGVPNRLPSFMGSIKAPIIAPMWGDMQLSQWSSAIEAPDQHGLVRYMRHEDGQRLYIYFKNLAPVRVRATQCGTFTAAADLRQNYDARYMSANVQIILDNRDNSVTILYRAFVGAYRTGFCSAPNSDITRWNNTCGVVGFARHQNYRRTDAESTTTPEYQQYTIMYDIDRVRNMPYPANDLAVKFRQWQNTLRVVDIQYLVRDFKLDPINNDLSFKKKVKSSEVANYELLAGEERLGAIQPVALIQNLSNNIQGPGRMTLSDDGGVNHFLMNFVHQDLQFRARFRITNRASLRLCYNKIVSIDSTCMALALDNRVACADDPNILIRLSDVEKSGNDYEATHWGNPVDDPANEFNDFPGDGTNNHEYVLNSGNTVSGRPFNGVPPYGMVQVFFPPFEPSEFIPKNIGRLQSRIIALAQDVEGTDLRGEWPFDDDRATPLFVMKRLDGFTEFMTDFYAVDGSVMPSVLRWVNINATVVDGDRVSQHALPPRGRWNAQYVDLPKSKAWDKDKINEAKFTFRNSPVLKMNRVTFGLQEPQLTRSSGETTNSGGDEIRSFPIDMIGKKNSILTLSVQRTEYQDNWDRGWADRRLYGPEPRVMFNGNPLIRYANARSVSQNPDELVVEFANNYVDLQKNRLQFVTNIKDKQWRLHFRGNDQNEETTMPALGIYGAGGYRIGFLEGHSDSVLKMNNNTEVHGLRANQFDEGIDEEFKKYFVAIPDTFINFPYELAQNFRFRIRVRAQNDQKPGIPRVPDDFDDFFVDNIQIIEEDIETTDIEVSSCKTVWPFTSVPATQATDIPIFVKLTNNSSTDAQSYFVYTSICRKGDDPHTQSLYCRKSVIPSHNSGSELEKSMPKFNAKQNGGPGEYTIYSWVSLNGDREPRNDYTWADFTVEFGDSYTLDQLGQPENDVPDFMLGAYPGKGLNFFGYSSGGQVSGAWDYFRFTSGEIGGNGSGQFAMKFVLQNADTIKGFSAYFASLNSAPDHIEFAVYSGNRPDRLVAGTKLSAQRGLDHVRKDDQGQPLRAYNEYTDYRLKKGVVLQPGTYWMTLSQDGETGLELGATKFNQGLRTTNVHIRPPEPVGIAGNSLFMNKNWRELATNGIDWYNQNFFMFQNSKNIGTWSPFSPTTGNPAYAHMHHVGIPAQTFNDTYTLTMSRGTWLPLMRPFLGVKPYNTNATTIPCPIPVELTEFEGMTTASGNQLFWTTASETNSKGFILERMLQEDQSADKWQQIEFVSGQGDSKVAQNYETVDNNVVNGTTYIYRLKQQDLDGSITCFNSNLVVLTTGAASDVVLKPSTPNPFVDNSTIEFVLAESSLVTLEVLDMNGNVVNTLENRLMNVGSHTANWTGNSSTGMKVTTGSYIYRLTVGETVLTQKVSLIK